MHFVLLIDQSPVEMWRRPTALSTSLCIGPIEPDSHTKADQGDNFLGAEHGGMDGMDGG